MQPARLYGPFQLKIVHNRDDDPMHIVSLRLRRTCAVEHASMTWPVSYVAKDDSESRATVV